MQTLDKSYVPWPSKKQHARNYDWLLDHQIILGIGEQSWLSFYGPSWSTKMCIPQGALQGFDDDPRLYVYIIIILQYYAHTSALYRAHIGTCLTWHVLCKHWHDSTLTVETWRNLHGPLGLSYWRVFPTWCQVSAGRSPDMFWQKWVWLLGI